MILTTRTPRFTIDLLSLTTGETTEMLLLVAWDLTAISRSHFFQSLSFTTRPNTSA
jgi:hypothetical protein